jgi:hypothetical protein
LTVGIISRSLRSPTQRKKQLEKTLFALIQHFSHRRTPPKKQLNKTLFTLFHRIYHRRTPEDHRKAELPPDYHLKRPMDHRTNVLNVT